MMSRVQEMERRLKDFDARHSPRGLLARYAVGRVKHFASRQILTLSGAVSLFFLASIEIGAIAAGLVLLGEAVDCLFLRTVPRRLDAGASFERLRALSTLTAAFQALTIAACVLLAWFTAPATSGLFFCLAYLTGAAINGGIVFPFHTHAASARLGIYALTLLGLFLSEALRGAHVTTGFYYNLLGTLIMAYMVQIFISYVSQGQRREQRNSRDLLEKGLEIAKANLSLSTQQKEMQRLALVAERAHDSVVMSDPTGRIFWINEAFTRITGYSAEDAIGKRPPDLLNAPETCIRTSDGIAAAIAAQKSHRAEIINRRKDGRLIWVETHLTPVFDDAGNLEMIVAIERDITATKAHQDELGRAKRAAEKGERAKARFLASMSHEIRTPMNGIIGMTELLAEENLSHDGGLYLDTIKHSAEALLTIINDILDFSKLKAGKLSISPVTFQLTDCFEGVLQLLRPQADQKGLTLSFHPTHLATDVSGDDGRLRQILINVVGNAIKFTNSGSVAISATTRMTETGYRLHVDVQDTGVGIAPEQIETIFDQFAQADAATTRHFGGTGLGLAISRLLARMMDGDISVRSTLGKGTCFSISVDLGLPKRASDLLIDDETLPPIDHFDGLCVLLAEDNRTNRLLIRKFVEGLPLRLICAHDGFEAVSKTAEHHPDIVLMDMSMPGMDGLEATAEIRRLPLPQPRIIALTANAYESDKKACLDAGMNAFLSKPVRRAHLLQQFARQSPNHAPATPPP
ncbi:MAG: ATP-binding protein [Pseudopelagicola sp.]|nr:ATP-binding protein [Pseudopelagicola sp.]